MSLEYRRHFILRLALHLLFWLLYLGVFTLLWGSYEGKYLRELAFLLSKLPIELMMVYFVLYYLIPTFLMRQKYGRFCLILLGVMLLGGIAERVIIFHLIYPIYFPEYLKEGLWVFIKIVKYSFGFNTIILLTSVIKITQYWYRDQKNAQNLAKEKLSAELQLLKGQIHPHFLFNTLNNLYSLTLKKSDLAPEVVLKLSELMDYMLHEANTPRIALEKEIKYLKNYVDLEKVRYGARVDIQFQAAQNLKGLSIAPLLLLPFLENAFKHGVSTEIEVAWIHIDLYRKGDYLVYKVENNRSEGQKKRSVKEYASGIGLQNLQKRLNLLYPNDHECKILAEDGSFLAVLKVKLQSLDAPVKRSNPNTPIHASI